MKNKIYEPAEDTYLLLGVIKEQIPKIIKKKSNLTFLEVGCGSGIQLQIAQELGVKKENIFATDLDLKAVECCKKLGFNCIQSDLFDNINKNKKFDLIVFNPPYLPEDKREPINSQIATTGGKKGSEIVNEFLKQAHKHLNKEGTILILVSSLTREIDFMDYKKELVGREKLFFEELNVWRLKK